MLKRVGWAVAVTLAVAGWVKAADNAPIKPLETTTVFRRCDNGYLVEFSTTVQANSTAMILSTMTFNNLTVPPDVAFTPSLTASTITTYGGRAYASMQVTSSAGNVYISVSTNVPTDGTKPFITQGTWFSLDDPISHQGPIFMKSSATFSVAGWIWFEKRR